MIYRFSILSSTLSGYKTNPLPFEGKNSPLLKLKTQTLRRFEALDNPRVYPIASASLVPSAHVSFEKQSESVLQLQVYTEPIQFNGYDSSICKYNYEVKKYLNSLTENDGNSFIYNSLKMEGLKVSSNFKVNYKSSVSFTIKTQQAYSTLRNSILYLKETQRKFTELNWVNERDLNLLFQIVQHVDSKKFPETLSLFTFFMIQYSILGQLNSQSCQISTVSDISKLVHFNSDLSKYFATHLKSSFKNEQELTTFVVDNIVDFYTKCRYSTSNCESKLYFAKKLGKQSFSFNIAQSMKDLYQGLTFPLQNLDITVDENINLDGPSDLQYVSLTLNLFSENVYDLSLLNGRGILNLVTLMPSLNLIASQSTVASSSISAFPNICMDKNIQGYYVGINKIPLGVNYLNKVMSVSNGVSTLGIANNIRLIKSLFDKKKRDAKKDLAKQKKRGKRTMIW